MKVLRQFVAQATLIFNLAPLLAFNQKALAQDWSSARSTQRLQEVEEVSQRLIGSKDSSSHALTDRDYVDVRVTHCEIRMIGTPGYLEPSKFLYVEQALSLSLNFPYRQRIVKLSPDQRLPSGVVSSIFESNLDPAELVGLCSKPLNERVLEWNTLTDAQCSVYLTKKGELWVGRTQRLKCPNNFRGASFVSSEVRLSREGMYSWDQGWDSNGNQVWGAVKGGYRFKNIDPATTDVEINAVAIRLTGKFNTAKQAAADPDNFRNISYDNCLIDAPEVSSQKGSNILLIDQSAKTENLSFRRLKFLAIERSEDLKSIKATYYGLKNPEKFSGQCENSKLTGHRLSGSMDDITQPECSLYFKLQGREFIGETPPEGCPSNYRGAEKLTVKARLSQYGLEVLEQWFDKDGKMVAGSTKGPYIYELLD